MSNREILCPECGNPMVLRTARRGANAGNQFYGCSQYPRCRKTIDINDIPLNDETNDVLDTDPKGLPSRISNLPRTLMAREIAQGLQVRFFHSLALDREHLLELTNDNLDPMYLRSLSQWRLDYPILSDTQPETVVPTVLEKILLRGRYTLTSPRLETEIGNIFPTRKNEGSLSSHDFSLMAVSLKSKGIRFEWFDSAEEALFFNEIIPEKYGRGFQKYILPQVQISSLIPSDSGIPVPGRVDFFISHPAIDGVVVEIDGKQHEGLSKSDQIRDGALIRQGFHVLRIPANEIREKAGHAVSNLFSILDRALVEGNRADSDNGSGKKRFYGIKAAHQIQVVLVQALLNGLLDIHNPSNWKLATNINELGYFSESESKKLLAATIGDFVELLENVSRLYSEPIEPEIPTIKIMGNKYTDTDQDQILILFGPSDYGNPNSFCIQDISFHHDVAGSLSPCSSSGYEITHPSANQVEYFLKYLFRKDGLWDGQYEGITRVLLGKDVLLLLPTGGGKSLVYQLSSLLLPGKTIVVDPIIALMEDQIDNLASYGIDRTVSITSQIESPTERAYLMQLFAQGEYIFTFVAPERFQSKEFRDALRTLTVHSPVSMIVIDEAHCVSEWGHDFRTAYLNMGRISREYCESEGIVPPLVGLTGTASRSVLKDVQRELQITEFDAIITPPSFDRPELSFGVIESRSEEKCARLKGYLKQKLPQLLKVSSSSLFQTHGDDTFAGLVFFPNVGGSFGVVENAEEISGELGIPVEFYSGSAPKRWGQGNWSEHKRRVASDYKRNRVPLLFSTNAFGMGIDKPNIRYTVHFGIPRSVEAFYQEAGRAGRNRKTSFCYILVSNDYPNRTNKLLDTSTPIEEVSRVVSSTSWDENDDITRMLFFHTNAFRGIAQEKRTIIQVLEQIEDWSVEGETAICADDITFPNQGRGVYESNEKRTLTEKALHRILILGIIHDYTIDYSRNEFTVRKTGATPKDIIQAYGKYVAGYNIQRSNVEVEKASAFLASPYDEFIEEMVDLVLNFIYEVIEKGRRRALQEMLLTAEASRNEQIRQRILRYLEETQFSEGLENIVTSARYDNSQVIGIAGGIGSPREAEELRGQVSRYLESYPDHPALLILRTVSESLSKDRDAIIAKQNLLAAASSALTKYSVPEKELFELIAWALIRIADADANITNELENEVLLAYPNVDLARTLVQRLPESLSSIPAWFLLDQLNRELQTNIKK